MGERVRAYGLGRTIAENNVEQCLAAIRQVRDQLAHDPGFRTARFAEYRDRHSVDQLSVAFAELLTATDPS